MRKIMIFDTTLRDGEQAPGATLTPQQKIVIARQLAKQGVDVIEPGFPISSPGDFAAVEQISREVTGVEICGFARAVKGDIDAAVKATRDAERRRLHMFLSSSSIHLDFQLRKSREQAIAMAREMVAYGKQFVDRIEFSPMDATRTGDEFLFEMIEAVIAEGATIINIPDTVGYALPDEYGAMFTRVMQNVRGSDRVEFSAHCHNDLGLAVANSLAAIKAGVSQVEVTVNGVGERAGNCSMEELVMALETRGNAMGAVTGIRTEEIFATSQMVSRAMSFPIAFNKPVVGRNAFQHEAGIHQDGLLKNRNTYEIMDPERLGVPRSMIILGKHSGRHAIRHRVSELGVELTDEQMEDFYASFKSLADSQKVVHDHQLMQLIGDAVNRVMEPYTLVSTQLVTGTAGHRVASCTIRSEATGEEKTYTGTGEGPVEAVVAGIKQALPFAVEFADLELYSLSSGEEASGEAIVTVRRDGASYRGIAAHRDILMAAAHAFMAACNQAAREAGEGQEQAEQAEVRIS
ncbi:2-isopropylmalate synthase [Paenibacillus mucilaginosus]|uniref:2-isopropylmalate synthase n=1 Tax=Paenibacillus mucilaginosus (strain KNP414) TaxID=1036673 RepID=F8FQE6_PAEMK|nr:2-isopropylmalate synthase [Paenibacillus mucilaginosus]AEI39207.1 probable 2-isopropylmalate synthase [Paenibacillus mucilaginosus KNP414]MCG7217149.1 2-isopropylmalate synthase [Paenibacillus mucilaginosus]WDM28218.1 2-isopropylmalate synthase [Paenibacillus mucilaginosus]